jgi:DnaJ-class molecular chaperone
VSATSGTIDAMGRETSFPDLYELLGASREAEPDELRAAYHARARELHPDAAADPEAEARFREVSHAYAVLSKPRSRLLYDRLAYRGPGGGGFGPVHEDVGKPTRESAHLSDDELVDWVFTDEPANPAQPVPREERFLRYLAAAALLVAVVFLVAILLN